MALQHLRQEIDKYAQNKTWYWYLPVWLFGLYLFIKLLDFELGGQSGSIFIAVAHNVNFFLHEMAHLFTVFLPDVMTAAAGSGSELLLATGLIIIGFYGKTYFASMFGFLWFMMSAQSTADYMADAKTLDIPLVSFGGSDPIHDWNFAFRELGLLEQSGKIAGIVGFFGVMAGLFGLMFSLYLIIRFVTAKREAAHKAFMDELMTKSANKHPSERKNEPFLGGDLYPTATAGRLADHEETKAKKPPV